MSVQRICPDAALFLCDRLSFVAKLLNGRPLVAHRLAVMDIDVMAQEVDKCTDMLLEQQVHVKNALILHDELDEQVRDAFRLPLGLFVPMTVIGVLRDDALRKLREIAERNKLRNSRGTILGKRVGETIHHRSCGRPRRLWWIVSGRHHAIHQT